MGLKTFAFLGAFIVTVVGCATPAVNLKNHATGQVARCGGGITGSMAGGFIGYSIEKDNDEKCAAYYEANGFKRVQ